MITEISEKINSLSEDSQNAAVNKTTELGFDPNKGVITLTESFINLNLIRGTLTDAIQSNKLVQLPITLQRQLNEQLGNVLRFLNGLGAGSDEIVNLVQSIESLNTIVWQWGLNNLSPEFLGYQTKLNQVKMLEVEIQSLRNELKQGLTIKKALNDAATEAQNISGTIKEVATNAEAHRKSAEENAKQCVDSQNKASASLTSIQESQKTATEQQSKAVTSSSEISAIELKIKEFFKQIDEYRSKADTIVSDAKITVNKNDEDVKALLKNLMDTQESIKDQIVQATGFSLFHSFDTRKKQLADGKMFWVRSLAALLALTLVFTVYIAMTHNEFDGIFYLKLSASIPIALAITFCSVQYSRERRLEEEYAFKGNISISLKPYQDLVEKIVSSAPGEREKYTAFMIESINKVFASPTDKIFNHSHEDRKPIDAENAEKALRQVVSLVKTVAKSMK